MKPIAITGLGIWDSLGYDLSSNLQQILTNKTRTPQCPTIRDFLGFNLVDAPAGLDEFREKNFYKLPSPKFNVVATWVVDQAIRQATLSQDRTRIGVFSASLFGDAESQIKTARAFLENRSRTGPGDLFYTINDTLVSTISRVNQLGGQSLSMSASCSTGLYAIEIGAALLEAKILDQVIIIAQDFCTSNYNTYRTVGTNVFSPTNTCRPMDARRDGIVFGDASAAMIIETTEHAQARGITPLAEVLAVASSTQYIHRTSSEKNKDCFYQSLDKMFGDDAISLDEVDWISGHLTGTQEGDPVENTVMSDFLPGRPITGFKGHLGHTMGACGLVELVYTVESLRQKVIPHMGNFESTDLETKLIIADKNINIDRGSTVLKNSYGFGGRAANILLRSIN